MIIKTFPAIKELSAQAALALAARIKTAVTERGLCSVVLAGGNTPRMCYRLLASILKEETATDHGFLSRIHWFAGDERYVSKKDDQRNEKMFETELFHKLAVPSENMHFWEEPPIPVAECGRRYDELLRAFFALNKTVPDIVLLGLGADGHIASLFPGSMAISADNRRQLISPEISERAFAVYRPDADTYRLSMSAGFLKTGRHVMMLVDGKYKKTAFSRLQSDDSAIPATWVAGPETECWITGNPLL